MAPAAPVKGSGGAQTALKTEGPLKAPAADKADKKADAPDPDNKSWQLMFPLRADCNLFDAGKPTGSFGDSSFGKPTDITLCGLHAGIGTNGPFTGKVRLEGALTLGYEKLSGGPQTNELSINRYVIEPSLALDWNRAYGFSHGLRLLDRLAIFGKFGYAEGTQALDRIRKRETSGPLTEVGARLGILGWKFPGATAMIYGQAALSQLDGSEQNTPGKYFGAGFEILLGTPKPKVQRTTISEPIEIFVCDQSIKDAHYYWNQAKDLQADNTKLREQLGSVKVYLEARPENPITVNKITKAQWLGYVEIELGKAYSDKIALVEKAAADAKKSTKTKAGEIFAAVEGITATVVNDIIADADAEYPADSYDFYTHNLVEEGEIPEKLAFVDPEDCIAANKQSDEMRKIWEGYHRNNATLTQKVDDIIMVGGLEGKPEVEQIVAASILDVNQPNFRTARATPNDVAALEKYITGASKKPLAVDDAGLIELLNIPRSRVKADNKGRIARGRKVFGDAKLELKKIKELADWLNGTRGLDSAKDLEIRIGGGDQKDASVKVNESSVAIKKIREWQKTVKLKIEGHTDQRGPNESNLLLSQMRAEEIRWLLIGFGVEPGRLKAVGYGEERPLAAESGKGEEIAAAQAKNRRVVFRLSGSTLSSAATIEEWGGKEVTISKDAENFSADDESEGNLDVDKKKSKSKAEGKNKKKAGKKGKVKGAAATKPTKIDPKRNPFEGLEENKKK